MSESRTTVATNDARRPLFAGVDLGGTNTKLGIVDDLGRTVAYANLPSEIEQGPEEWARRVGDALAQAAAEVGLADSDVVRVGLGTPGTMDIPAGMLIEPVNLKGERGDEWNNFPIRDRVAHHCGLPTSFANDAAAAAYGEFWVGSGRDLNSLVLFTLGTGIGGGIIIGGLSIDGENSHGAECGHIIVNDADDARLCGCGQPGHLEAYASAIAVIKQTRELLDAGRSSSLVDRLGNGTKLTPKLIAAEAETGDELSLEIIMEVARYMGIGAVNLMHTVDPSGVLLGGAMTFGGNATELGRRFLARNKQEIDRRAFTVLAERIVLDYASLGGDAGYIGAAGIARADHASSQPAS
jgi:glucokinase